MNLDWKPLYDNDKTDIVSSNSTKPLYKVRLKNGSEVTVFLEGKELVEDTFDKKPVNMDDIVEYAIIGE